MADTTTAPATAPTTTAPAAPAPQGATVTPLKPHHSATQPRDVGKFAGPPQPGDAQPTVSPPAKPKTWKVGDYETTDPDELAAIAAERVVDHAEHQRLRTEYQRLQAEAERWKDPSRALTAEQKAAIARQALEEFYQREQEAKLPPEQRRILEERRALAAENQRLREEFEKRKREEAGAQEQQDKEALVGRVRAVLGILGEEERPGVVAREVLAEMRASLLRDGREYPPEVVARNVRMRLEREGFRQTARVAKGNPAALLSNPEIVAALNSIQDPGLLQSLAPLIDFGRRANLERLGAAPAPGTSTPPAASAPAAEVPQGRDPRTDQEWRAWFAAGNKPSTPAQYQAQQRGRIKGWL